MPSSEKMDRSLGMVTDAFLLPGFKEILPEGMEIGGQIGGRGLMFQDRHDGSYVSCVVLFHASSGECSGPVIFDTVYYLVQRANT